MSVSVKVGIPYGRPWLLRELVFATIACVSALAWRAESIDKNWMAGS